MDGMPGFVSRGRTLSIIDWLVNEERDTVRRQVTAPRAKIEEILEFWKDNPSGNDPRPTKAEIGHVVDDWLGDNWWTSSQYPSLPDEDTRNKILIGAYAKALDLAAAREAECENPAEGFKVCIETYWICHGRAFESYILDNPRLIVVILMTPPPPPMGLTLDEDEDIHAVGTQKRIRQLEGGSGGSDQQAGSTRLKTAYALVPRAECGCCGDDTEDDG